MIMESMRAGEKAKIGTVVSRAVVLTSLSVSLKCARASATLRLGLNGYGIRRRLVHSILCRDVSWFVAKWRECANP